MHSVGLEPTTSSDPTLTKGENVIWARAQWPYNKYILMKTHVSLQTVTKYPFLTLNIHP